MDLPATLPPVAGRTEAIMCRRARELVKRARRSPPGVEVCKVRDANDDDDRWAIGAVCSATSTSTTRSGGFRVTHLCLIIQCARRHHWTNSSAATSTRARFDPTVESRPPQLTAIAAARDTRSPAQISAMDAVSMPSPREVDGRHERVDSDVSRRMDESRSARDDR
jgi:hypothetical protein